VSRPGSEPAGVRRMADDPDRFLAFANELADAAGAILRHYFRTPVEVEDKADESPVTIADRETEAELRRLIEARFPDHGIDGEEFPPRNPGADLTWSLDPIDGTKAFITGRPLFGTLISLVRDGRPLLGVIDQCILGERWVGAAGRPSTLNGREIRVRPCGRLGDAVLSTTSPLLFADGSERAAYGRVEAAVKLPMFGGDCYAYGLLATGFADLIVEAGLDGHDFLALVPVVEGAGGVMTDWQGRALTAHSDGRVLAAGDRRIHEATVELLAQHAH
jgi:inositol-phosphate phosphatase/L-galactose 1-phosphate phosphatase/histidinol-phosphatase